MGKKMSETSPSSEATLEKLLSEVKEIKGVIQQSWKRPRPEPEGEGEPEGEEDSEGEGEGEGEDYPEPEGEGEVQDFFSFPYNALAYGLFKMLKDRTGPEALEPYTYCIIRRGGDNECEILIKNLQKALLRYLLNSLYMQGPKFADRLLGRVCTLMTESGWNSRYDATTSTRIAFTLDYPYDIWIHDFPDMHF